MLHMFPFVQLTQLLHVFCACFIEGVLGSKHLFSKSRKLTGAAKNLGVHTFPDPFGHFETPAIFDIAGVTALQEVLQINLLLTRDKAVIDT